MPKIFNAIERVCKSPAFRTVMIAGAVFAAATPVAFAADATVTTANELNDVWVKVSNGVKGTYGKLASIGIIGASIWNREKIGMLAMGVGILIGAMIPSIPGWIDGFKAN